MNDSSVGLTIMFNTSKAKYNRLVKKMVDKKYLDLKTMNSVFKDSKIVITQIQYDGPWNPDTISPAYEHISVTNVPEKKVKDIVW